MNQPNVQTLKCSTVPLDNDIIQIITRPLNGQQGEFKQDVCVPGDRFQPKYPPSQVVIRRLNEAFGYNWSDEVISTTHSPDFGEVIVHVRLTVNLRSNSTIHTQVTHDGLGRCILHRNATGFSEYGNDVKAAHSDGLRKAATKFGFSLDLYDKDESSFQGMQLLNAPSPDPAMEFAPNFQVGQVVDLMEGRLRIPRQDWLAALQIGDPSNMTVLTAQEILAGRHPVFVHYSGGQQYSNGIHSSNA